MEKEKIVISGEVTVSGTGKAELGCIELIENGYILVPDAITELIIEQLMVNKEYSKSNDFDILVTGEDGKNAASGSGEDGEDGKDGGKVKITIKDLVNDVYIKASGGNGGNGGSGIDKKNNGKGGNGGKGGDGAHVEFHYNKENSDSISCAYVRSVHGGFGGSGGDGGINAEGVGKGGIYEQKGTVGDKNGDGGDGGTNGKDGEIIIYYPDGGKSINGVECDSDALKASSSSVSSITGTRMINYGDDRDFRMLIQKLGGEYLLKKSPHLLDVLLYTRKQSKIAANTMSDSADTDIQIEGGILEIQPIKVGSRKKAAADTKSAEAGYYDSSGLYEFTADVSLSFANSSGHVSENTVKSAPVVPESYLLYVTMTNKNEPSEVLYRTVLHGYGDNIMHPLDKITTDPLPMMTLLGKTLVLNATVTYVVTVNDNKQTISADLKESVYDFPNADPTSPISSISITAPHWKKDKGSGTVMFLYGRTPSSNIGLYKDADYYGGDYYSNDFTNGKVHTIIPMSGEITLLQNLGAEKIVGASIESYKLGSLETKHSYLYYTLSGSATTIAVHRENTDDLGEKLKANGALTYDANKNIATFDLKLPASTAGRSDYDWEYDIDGNIMKDSSHICYLRGVFMLGIDIEDENKNKRTDHYQINIISDDSMGDQEEYFISVQGRTTVIIPPIQIFWGCYGKETLIRVENGDVKRADEIQIGDKLLSYGGKLLTVENILTGEDPEIYRIETADGNYIRVSGGHAMKVYDESLPDGTRVTACCLKTGDMLMGPEGVSEVVKVSVESYNDTVYNFVFEGENQPNYIEANGYWSGDYYAQNEEEKKEPAPLSEESKLLIIEIEKLAEQMKLKEVRI